MLQLGSVDEQTSQLAVDTIVRSARTQAELIDDLLDISPVVAGTLHLAVTTVDLATIVEDVLMAARPAADARGLTLQRENTDVAAFLPYVWDRFRQADSSTSCQHGGLGLGLAVVRHLVELHGGTVSVDGAGAGRGSRFTVEMPLARLDSAAASAMQVKAKGDTLSKVRRDSSIRTRAEFVAGQKPQQTAGLRLPPGGGQGRPDACTTPSCNKT